MGDFRTTAHIYMALLNHKKIQNVLWTETMFIHLVAGDLRDDEGNIANYGFSDPGDWRLYKPKPQVIEMVFDSRFTTSPIFFNPEGGMISSKELDRFVGKKWKVVFTEVLDDCK